MNQFVLSRIEGYDELRRGTLRWVVRQGRDPEQAIKSICAEMVDIRTVPMFLAKLSEEKAIESDVELEKILRLLGGKNLRSLGYLLRAHLLIHHGFYSALRTDIKTKTKELSFKEKTAKEVEQEIYKEFSDRLESICEHLYGKRYKPEDMPDELKKRVTRWIEESMEDVKKNE